MLLLTYLEKDVGEQILFYSPSKIPVKFTYDLLYYINASTINI